MYTYDINTGAIVYPDPSIMWYRIEGFNGYEYCITTDQVRSFKQIKKFPFGKILRRDTDGCWELSKTLNNDRLKLNTNDIMNIINNSRNKPVPIPTDNVYIGGWNKVSGNKNRNERVEFPSFDGLIIKGDH